MTRRVAVVALVVGLAGCGASDPTATVAPPAESVVQVLGEFCGREQQGSGIIVDDGILLTSAHVLAGSEGGLAARRPDEQDVAATLVAFDPQLDLALLSAPGIGGTSATFGDPSAETRGVIGTMTVDGELELLPFAVDRPVIANSGDIYDEGEVTRAALQLSAATFPGDSGGALFDSTNRVVGIVFAQSRQTESVAYALAVEEVTAFLSAADTAVEVAAGRCR